jgi:hypothetical protein
MLSLRFEGDLVYVLRDGAVVWEMNQKELDELRAIIVDASGEE